MMITSTLGEGTDPIVIVGIFLGLLGDQFGAESGVFDPLLVADEGAHEVDDLGVVKVVEQTVRANDHNVSILHFMCILIGLLWIIATSADLIWEVEAMLLLLGSEYFLEIVPISPQNHVP